MYFINLLALFCSSTIINLRVTISRILGYWTCWMSMKLFVFSEDASCPQSPIVRFFRDNLGPFDLWMKIPNTQKWYFRAALSLNKFAAQTLEEKFQKKEESCLSSTSSSITNDGFYHLLSICYYTA